MDRIRIAHQYTCEWLETDRPRPLSDNAIEKLITQVLSGNIDSDISDEVYENFKLEAMQWIISSKLNTLSGLDSFERTDICIESIYLALQNGQPVGLSPLLRYLEDHDIN